MKRVISWFGRSQDSPAEYETAVRVEFEAIACAMG